MRSFVAISDANLGMLEDKIGRETTQGTQKMTTIKELCDLVRETAYSIHVYHGHGHLEKVYENALAHRLRKAGLKVEQQYPLNVYDEDGALIGEYFADLFVDGRLIVELKACRKSSRRSYKQTQQSIREILGDRCSIRGGRLLELIRPW